MLCIIDNERKQGEDVVDSSESLHPVFLCNCSVWLQLHFLQCEESADLRLSLNPDCSGRPPEKMLNVMMQKTNK